MMRLASGDPHCEDAFARPLGEEARIVNCTVERIVAACRVRDVKRTIDEEQRAIDRSFVLDDNDEAARLDDEFRLASATACLLYTSPSPRD